MARILVVDDEQFVRDLLVKILARAGHDVTGAGDAAAALASLGSATFDIVVTDVVMPGMDGFELLRRIKGGWPAVRVVVLTGYARKQNIAHFLLYGADQYLAKPFQVHELLAAVETLSPVASATRDGGAHDVAAHDVGAHDVGARSPVGSAARAACDP